MPFLSRTPCPPLDAFVESIWACRQDPRPLALERVLPTGAAQLIINLMEDETRLYDPDRAYRCVSTAGSVLTGVQSSYQVIDTAEQEFVAGVAFRPGGTLPFIRVPASETTDLDVPLADLWGAGESALLRERLLEAPTLEATLGIIESALLARWTPRGFHPAIAFALTAFDHGPVNRRIGEVGDATGLSAKRFIERFKREVGLTPKRYCRIRRFQHAATRAHRGKSIDWAQLAVVCGYADQAHFIHDFRAFAGVTPTGYGAGRTPSHNHVKFLQSSDPAAVRA